MSCRTTVCWWSCEKWVGDVSGWLANGVALRRRRAARIYLHRDRSGCATTSGIRLRIRVLVKCHTHLILVVGGGSRRSRYLNPIVTSDTTPPCRPSPGVR